MNKRDRAIKLLEDMRINRPKPLFIDLDSSSMGVGFVLGYLYKHQNNEVSAGKIAKELHVSTARMAVLLNKMEKQGLLIKETSKNDARKTIVKITEKGSKLALENYEKMINRANKLIEKVGEEDIKTFIEISKKIKEVMENEDI